MAEVFHIKRHDLRPPLRLQLLSDGVPVDLSNAGSARLVMGSVRGVKVDGPVTILEQTGETVGIVEYDWQDGDTDTTGTFSAEVEVLWAGQVPETFPADSYFKVKVVKDLNDGPTAEPVIS